MRDMRPVSGRTAFLRGNIALALGRRDEAEEAFWDAYFTADTKDAALVRIAELEGLRGDFNAAKRHASESRAGVSADVIRILAGNRLGEKTDIREKLREYPMSQALRFAAVICGEYDKRAFYDGLSDEPSQTCIDIFEDLSRAGFADEAAEALAVIHAKDESNVESIHEDLRHQILDCKDVHKVDSSTDNMDFFNHMPRFLGKFLVWILTRLDIHGWIPASIIETDPYYTTCVISNLGSIKLNCGYHHLTNWGTCSVFCIIGEKSKRPVYHEDGTIEMREMLDLGLTIDERLADGYYYSKTIRLLKTLLENPELLETPANQEVEY